MDQFVAPGGGHHIEKLRSFELYRRNVLASEIITFDELLARAEWIVDFSEVDPQNDPPNDDDEWPF